MRCGVRLFHLLLILVFAACGTPVYAQVTADPALFEGFRAADLRLATAGYRLSTANAALCDRLEPGHGIQVHTLDQYAPALRPAVAAHFRFAGALAVEGVVSGSPAERAGVRPDDTIVRFGDIGAGLYGPAGRLLECGSRVVPDRADSRRSAARRRAADGHDPADPRMPHAL
jgi:hypothetical protein